MTVCVAAIANYLGRRIVVGASDRMITAGDIEFEQEQRKIHLLTSSIAIMVAGDLCIQADILHELEAWKDKQIEDFPNEWIRVKMVADKFYEILAEAKRRMARSAILSPLGLDFDKLTSRTISTELSMQLSKEILEFQIAPIEAIVMGADRTGTHIYVVDGRGVCCQDWLGFAAIGYGGVHANSQMMFVGHVKARDFAETVMSVYSSKKRGEVAPGVGEETDMVVMGPGLGDTLIVGEELMEELAKTYQESREKEKKVREDANAKINQFFEAPAIEASVQSQNEPPLEFGSDEVEYAKAEEVAGEEAPTE